MRQTDGSVLRIESNKGMTVFELVIVLSIIAILLAFAAPFSRQLIRNEEYRASARNIAYMLREARNISITTNLEHRVEFDSTKKRYRLLRGNRATDSTAWNAVVYDWRSVSPNVYLDADVEAIHLNPTGTANAGTIRINDETHRTRCKVVIARTGRIRVPAVL
ncbi:MAG TPA: GspH/FimT family pseudopilin [Nitrospirota bacterium]|nr:GspH/FimT family pseudopilin [Nitrospirota bacterium]